MAKLERAFLICFVGMDGAGKTTQAKNLVDVLQARGIKCKYVWNTYQPFITKPFLLLAKVLFLRGKNAFENYAEYSGIKRNLLRNSFLAQAYERLSLLDYLCQYFITIRVPHMLGRNVVCDRYAQDLVVNLAVELDYPDKKVKNTLERLLHLLLEPDLVFLMDVPEEIGYARKNDTPSIEHLKQRRGVYLSLGKECGATILDGSKDIEELEHIVQDRVREILG